MTSDELAVRRHRLGGVANGCATLLQSALQSWHVDAVDQWVIASRVDVLAKKDRHPTGLEEGFVSMKHDAAAALEHLDLLLQGIRHTHLPAVAPERRVVSLRGVIMQDEEVTDALEFQRSHPVVLGAHHRVEVAIREHLDQ